MTMLGVSSSKTGWPRYDKLNAHHKKRSMDTNFQNTNYNQRFNNLANQNHKKIEGILESLGDIYTLRKNLQSSINKKSPEISSQ